MPCEDTSLLSCFNIPQFDGSVITTTSKGFAILADGDRPNYAKMVSEATDLLSCFDIPQFDGSVMTTTGKGFAIWADGNRKNPAGMPFESSL